MMDQGGFPEEEAKGIEKNYHELYEASDEWVEDKIEQACKDGFVTVAFGLRLRTPLLAKTLVNKSFTPYEAQAEARTAGNALGQSYCMLNNRAAVALRKRILKSPYKHDIRMIGLIHDAIYLICKDNIDVVHWLNINLPDVMTWQNLLEIQHDKVKLSGALDIFHPTWADAIGLPVGANQEEILQICKEAMI